MASCGSHSAGMRKPSAAGVSASERGFVSAQEARRGRARRRAVGVDAAVAQEGPVAARLSCELRVALGDQDLLASCGALARTRPNGSATNEPPQNSMPPPCRRASRGRRGYGRDVHAVGDRVRRAGSSPRRRAGLAVLGLLGRVPADRGRDRRGSPAPLSAVSRAASGYHWSQQTSVPTRPTFVSKAWKPEVAGREVVLLVVERVVGDVHLAVDARRASRRRRGRPPCCGRRRPPAARRPSAMTTTPASRAAFASASVVGPGIGSARSKSFGSSVWQK